MNDFVIKVDKLSKYFSTGFKKKRVLNSISFEIKKGEIFGFLGPNGAGKTTTMKIITGLLHYDEGKIEIFGKQNIDEEVRKKTSFLPEQPYFYDHLTGKEFLELTALLYGVPKKERESRISELLEVVGMNDAKDKKIRTYSRGMLQRIGIANALVADPEFLILDEPLTGLDPIGRKEIKDLIYSQKEKGKTIFFSSHILSDVEEICDRIAIIHNGKILKTGTPEQILKEEVKMYEIVFKNIDIKFLKDYDFYKKGEEVIIKIEENHVNSFLQGILNSFKEVKIIRVVPEIFSLEEWFADFIKKKEKADG